MDQIETSGEARKLRKCPICQIQVPDDEEGYRGVWDHVAEFHQDFFRWIRRWNDTWGLFLVITLIGIGVSFLFGIRSWILLYLFIGYFAAALFLAQRRRLRIGEFRREWARSQSER